MFTASYRSNPVFVLCRQNFSVVSVQLETCLVHVISVVCSLIFFSDNLLQQL